MERLRPLVDSKAWDYCVVWKLGDDPSRFIEWMGCCCSGGGDAYSHMKEEKEYSGPVCRDIELVHPVRSKACEALAKCPCSLPLYSGIHGDVVISNQTRWLYPDPSNFHECHFGQELVGTRVLIPVIGGIVELFSEEHIPREQKIIELVKKHCILTSQQDFMTVRSCAEEKIQNYAHAVQLFSNFSPSIEASPQLTQFNTDSAYEISPSSSGFSNDQYPSPVDINCGYLSQNGILKQSIYRPSGSKRPKSNNCNVLEDNTEDRIRAKRERNQSKNLITERNRRNRIKDGIFALRALVPKISKMDKAATLGDAVEYIKELEQEIKKLRDELKENEEEDFKKDNNAETKSWILDELPENTSRLSPTHENKDNPSCIKTKNTQVHVEVNQIGKTEFLIKILNGQKPGAVPRLMEMINSLGLGVVDANITTFNGRVLSILRLEAQKKEIQPAQLRESLIRLGGC